jgi:hypothetical protein
MKDPIELERIRISLRKLAYASNNTHDTGFVAEHYKRQLVEMKWFIEDLLEDCPTFSTEKQWEQNRVVDKLKQEEKQRA